MPREPLLQQFSAEGCRLEQANPNPNPNPNPNSNPSSNPKQARLHDSSQPRAPHKKGWAEEALRKHPNLT